MYLLDLGRALVPMALAFEVTWFFAAISRSILLSLGHGQIHVFISPGTVDWQMGGLSWAVCQFVVSIGHCQSKSFKMANDDDRGN